MLLATASSINQNSFNRCSFNYLQEKALKYACVGQLLLVQTNIFLTVAALTISKKSLEYECFWQLLLVQNQNSFNRCSLTIFQGSFKIGMRLATILIALQSKSLQVTVTDSTLLE